MKLQPAGLDGNYMLHIDEYLSIFVFKDGYVRIVDANRIRESRKAYALADVQDRLARAAAQVKQAKTGPEVFKALNIKWN